MGWAGKEENIADPVRSAEESVDEAGTLSDVLRWLADLGDHNPINEEIIRTRILFPGMSYADMARRITRKYGTVQAVTPNKIRKLIDRFAAKHPELAGFLGQPITRPKRRRRPRASYNNADQ